MADANSTTAPRYASDPDPSKAAGLAPRLHLAPMRTGLRAEEKPAEVLRLAQDAFTKTDNWVVFFREMMGVDGVVRKLFSTPEEMRQFECSPAFAELQEMVAAIRSQDTSKGDTAEPERMITIRLPKSLHDVLKCEADETNLSINKLCISKLLQRIDGRFVPVQQGRRRGRRPGPQGPRSSTGGSSDSAGNAPEATLEKAPLSSPDRMGSAQSEVRNVNSSANPIDHTRNHQAGPSGRTFG
tara:strand:+ start:7381 stop:8103 length:723 start_codon:yes stop_codon:yes gene_type:complete